MFPYDAGCLLMVQLWRKASLRLVFRSVAVYRGQSCRDWTSCACLVLGMCVFRGRSLYPTSLSQPEFMLQQTLARSICPLGRHWCGTGEHIESEECAQRLRPSGFMLLMLLCYDWIKNDGSVFNCVFLKQSSSVGCGFDGELQKCHFIKDPHDLKDKSPFFSSHTLLFKRFDPFLHLNWQWRPGYTQRIKRKSHTETVDQCMCVFCLLCRWLSCSHSELLIDGLEVMLQLHVFGGDLSPDGRATFIS